MMHRCLAAPLISLLAGFQLAVAQEPQALTALHSGTIVLPSAEAHIATRQQSSEVCVEPDSPALLIRPFNAQRAVPSSFVFETWIEAVGKAEHVISVKVSPEGVPSEAQIVQRIPADMPQWVDQFVLAEAHRMRFSAARQKCKAVAALYEFRVTYAMEDYVFEPLSPPPPLP